MKKFTVLIIVVSTLLGIPSCAERGKTYSLKGQWEYRVDFKKEWFEDTPDQRWQKVTVPVFTKDIPGLERHLWFNHFQESPARCRAGRIAERQ